MILDAYIDILSDKDTSTLTLKWLHEAYDLADFLMDQKAKNKIIDVIIAKVPANEHAYGLNLEKLVHEQVDSVSTRF